MVALAALYLGYHWLTDVLASTGAGVAVTGIVILVDGLRTARPRAPGCGRRLSRKRARQKPDAQRLGDHHGRG